MSGKKPTDTLIFKIDAYTPETIPMARLAEYMADLAKLYGHTESVHFVKMKKGSACLVSRVDKPDVPKVRSRLFSISNGDGDPDAMKAYAAIDKRLAEDNAIGRLLDETTKNVIEFPGRNRIQPQVYGPISKEGSIDGILTLVGGRDKTISLQLQTDNTTYSYIETDRITAKRISAYLFEPIRVHGRGRWTREEDGIWKLKKFTVRDFDVLERSSFESALNELRKVQGSKWTDFENPLDEIKDIRDGENIH